MISQKEQAERLRLGIRGGWLSVQEAVSWADKQILMADAPHPSLLELSLAGVSSRSEVCDLLTAVPGSADHIAIMRACLADLRDLVVREPSQGRAVARWLFSSACAGDLPEASFGWHALALEDNWSLADQGLGTPDTALAELVSYLEDHERREA